jgi:O-antigen biosynthesis protein
VELIRRIVRELKKNSLPDFVRKTAFYYFGKGRFLWAMNEKEWNDKKEVSQQVFSKYQNGQKEGKEMIVVLVIPGTWISGGIAVIVRHANMLKSRGYQVYLVTQDLKSKIPWYRDQHVEVVPIDRIRKLLDKGIDILIATGWNSVPTVDLLPAKRKLYFVQSDERKFYNDSALQNFIEATYRVSFEYVTMAHFLQNWLKAEFGHDSVYVPNGLDTDIFRPVQPLAEKSGRMRVLIEGPINIPFKGVAEAYEAVLGLECEVWIVSSNGRPPKDWKYDRFFVRVPLHEMPALYSSCDILLKMSTIESFCYPPLEMMACGGVPVILEVTGIDEYAQHDKNCLIVKDKIEARTAVMKLLADPVLYSRLQSEGRKTASDWNWERSADMLEKVLLTEVEGGMERLQ